MNTITYDHKNDYYTCLGVKDSDDDKKIKMAYYKLAQKYHPDKQAGREAEERFKAINNAYEVLKDEASKKTYNRLREEYRNP